MKLTLEIPNEHAPALLALLSDLMPVRLEPQADPAEGHPELPLMPAAPVPVPVSEWAAKWVQARPLPLMPAEQYMAARVAEGELEEIGSLNTPDLAAKWIAAGGDVPPTPEQLAAMSRLPDEDPALADVRWQATPEATPEPEPWDVPTPTDAAVGFAAGTNGKLEVVALDETNPDPTQRVLAWPQELLSIALPEKPEGKTKWVYRGTFKGQNYDGRDRSVFYYSTSRKNWIRTYDFSTTLHHVEAI